MIFRSLTPAGDWSFGQGVASYATTDKAIALNIQTRVQSWIGDCFFSVNDFVDWPNLSEIGQEDNLAQAIKQVILQSFGVVKIVSFSYRLNPATRAFSFSASIQTIFSPSFQLQMSLQSGLAQGAQ